ncbi:MAG: hypothetical protein B9S34_09755 [Opitutia bacterium Tous-C1TDCM]|nr:MAG: hypothetical protein B9S34_09755 [Opitutae bacterium Tous-C1TDCM]
MSDWHSAGRPPRDDRLVVAAMWWALRMGASWRDGPRGFGPWNSQSSASPARPLWPTFPGAVRTLAWSTRVRRFCGSPRARPAQISTVWPDASRLLRHAATPFCRITRR